MLSVAAVHNHSLYYEQMVEGLEFSKHFLPDSHRNRQFWLSSPLVLHLAIKITCLCSICFVKIISHNVAFIFLKGNEECFRFNNSSVWWLCSSGIAGVVTHDIFLYISWSTAVVFPAPQSCDVTGCFSHYRTEMCYTFAANSTRNECKIQPLPLTLKDKVW